MGNTAVISFDDQVVKVVYASFKAGSIMVHDALVLKEGQLDGFLEKEKTKEFVVVNNFKETYNDLIEIPSTRKKYHKKIIELEIRKRCEFDDFSFIHLPAGEKIIDNKKVSKVLVFAVRNHETDEILRKFSARGKTVKGIYPDIFPLSTMIDTSGKAVLCVAGSGPNKTLFLVKDSRIAFVRQALGNEPGINDFDIHNIDMTANYCRQTLRINPAQIMLTGSLCSDYKAQKLPYAPFACLMPPRSVQIAGAAGSAFHEFITPVSALNAETYMDVSPEWYRGVRRKKKLLKYSTGVFAALSAATLIFAGSAASDAVRARSWLKALQPGLPDIEVVISSYDREKAALNEYAPVIASINSLTSPDMHGLFLAVSDLYTGNVMLNLISVTPAGEALRCRLEGVINASSYSEAQAYYDRIIASVDKAKGLVFVRGEIALKDRSFFLEVDYR